MRRGPERTLGNRSSAAERASARRTVSPSSDPALTQLRHQAGNRAVARLLLQRQEEKLEPAEDHGPGQVPALPFWALPQSTAPEPDHAECFVAWPPEVESESDAGGSAEGAAGVAALRSSAPTSRGLTGAVQASWAAIGTGDGDGARAIPGPSVATLAAIQAAAGGSTGTVGWTSFPMGTAKAPQFDMGSVSSSPGGMGPPSWSSTPTWTQHFYEGDSVCMFLGAGRHPTTLTEGGKAVFFELSAAMSSRDSDAEAEHSNDIKRARDISIKEAETVLTDHVIGTTFPSRGTKAEAEQLVLDRITSKLTNAGLGNDQTKWAGIYETLYRKTLERDNKAWHTFGLGPRTVNAAGEVTYALNAGTTSINTTTSTALIVY
jgi:hypothetical protein